MSLTGINTLLSMVTLPIICGWAQWQFSQANGAAASPIGKLAWAMATLLAPVAFGMIVRVKAPGFAVRADRPMRVFSVLALVAFSVAAIVSQWASLRTGFAEVGLPVITFNVMSLALGFVLARAVCSRESAIAISFELGVRSAVLSIYVAMTTLQDDRIALPAAVYSVTMVILALSFGALLNRTNKPAAPGMQSQPGT